MPTNQYKKFATGVGANTLTPTAWAALTTLLDQGFQPGLAASEQANTILRQLSVAVTALAQFIVDQAAVDVNDNGNAVEFQTKLKSALDATYIQDLSGLVPYTQFNGSGRQDVSGADGWQRFPGNLILQWAEITIGDVPSGVHQYVINYPLAVDEVLGVQLTMHGDARALICYVISFNTTSATVEAQETASAYTQNCKAQILVIGRKA